MTRSADSLTILHLVSLRGMGGRAATALRQARLLAGRGHRVLLGCLAGSAVAARARELDLEVFSAFQFQRGFRPLIFWRDCRRLVALCNSQQVEVLHAHLSQESWAGCVAARLAARPPVFVRSRGVVVPVRPHFFNRLLHNRLTDCVVTPSKVIHAQLCRAPGFDQNKIRLIPEGVDLVHFSPGLDSISVRREFQLRPEARLIVLAARLERVKGHAVFFQALKEITQGRGTGILPVSHGQDAHATPCFHALCACDERTPGAYEAIIRSARELGLTEEVLSFTGLRPDIEKIIAAANIIVLPSLGSEGSSRVGLEAAASGVPVVASAVGCLPEVVADGVTGLLVPPGDAHALAQALLALLQDPKRAQAMGEKARQRAEELYDEQVMVRDLEQLYLDAVAKRKAARK